jgi:hypothetical protein
VTSEPRVLDPIAEARVAIDSARRRHERLALIAAREHKPLTRLAHAAAALRLRQYGPGETTVIRKFGDPAYDTVQRLRREMGH